MYILAATVITLSQVYADVCGGAFSELEAEIKPILNKRIVSYDDMYNFSLSIDIYRLKVANKPCAAETLVKIATYKNDVKGKRLNTIQKSMKFGIKQEAGKDLAIEEEFLSGKNPKAVYEFAGAFNPEAIVEVKPEPRPEPKPEPKKPEPRPEPKKPEPKKPEPKKPEPKKPEPKPRPDVKPKPPEIIVIPPSKVEPVVVEEPVVVIPPKVDPVRPMDPTCTDVIHQNETVNLNNVRNQDGVGWCYAYTAADMLSFKLNQKVSAVSLADPPDIEADVALNARQVGGIIEGSARKYLNKNRGVCLERDLPSSDFKFCIDQRYQDYINYLLDLARNNTFDQNLNTNACLEKDLRALFPNVSIPQVQSLIRQKGSRKLIESLNELQCRNLTPVNPQSLEMDTYNSFMMPPADLVKHLDREIARGVVGIGYDYRTMVGASETGGHASLVVGRRSNPATGACEYLIRNSWGKSCEQQESSDVSCHKNCDTSGKDCRYSGHFWVSKARMTSAIKDVNYFKR